MRKLILPCLVAMVGLALVVAPPAEAKRLHWHTVMKLKGAKVQTCRKGDVAYFRINNHHGKRWGSFKMRGTVNGSWVGDGSIGAFAPHEVTTKIGGTYYSNEVDKLTLKLDRNRHHKKVKKTKRVSPAAFHAC